MLLQALTKGGVTYKDEVWHKECFLCTGCKAPLAGQPFTSQGESPYCVKCFSSLYAKKCAGCNTAITGQSGCWGGRGVSPLLAHRHARAPLRRLCDSGSTRSSTVSQQTGVGRLGFLASSASRPRLWLARILPLSRFTPSVHKTNPLWNEPGAGSRGRWLPALASSVSPLHPPLAGFHLHFWSPPDPRGRKRLTVLWLNVAFY